MTEILRAHGILVDADPESPGLRLNVSDLFARAADWEDITENDLPIVYALWRAFGWPGVAWWIWQRRGTEPLPEVREEIEKAIKQDI